MRSCRSSGMTDRGIERFPSAQEQVCVQDLVAEAGFDSEVQGELVIASCPTSRETADLVGRALQCVGSEVRA